MTTRSTSLRLADILAREPYVWPGGYPRFGILDDGEALCPDCARTEREQLALTTGSDGWCLQGIETNWEDQDLTCANCNQPIECAYPED